MAKDYVFDADELDDMACELHYIKESYYNNNGYDPFGRKLTVDELLMIGVMDEGFIDAQLIL